MNTLVVLQIFLIIHLTGLILMAGTTAADYIVFRVFSRQFEQKKKASASLLELKTKLSLLLGIGGAFLIISGIGLMIVTNGVFGHQIWFKIKMVLLLLLILNGFLVKGRAELKLKKYLYAHHPELSDQLKGPMLHLKFFYLTQLGIFLTIVILAVFKFN